VDGDLGRVNEAQAPIAILYEHPLWFEPLFAELDRRGAPYVRLHASELMFDPGAQGRTRHCANRFAVAAPPIAIR
jgi:hypothetical protein